MCLSLEGSLLFVCKGRKSFLLFYSDIEFLVSFIWTELHLSNVVVVVVLWMRRKTITSLFGFMFYGLHSKQCRVSVLMEIKYLLCLQVHTKQLFKPNMASPTVTAICGASTFPMPKRIKLEVNIFTLKITARAHRLWPTTEQSRRSKETLKVIARLAVQNDGLRTQRVRMDTYKQSRLQAL